MTCPSAGAQLLAPQQIDNSGQSTGAAKNTDGYQQALDLSQLQIRIPTLDPEIELIGKPPTSFLVGGKFMLPAKGTINPVKETVAVQLNAYHITIRSGSFKKSQGIYVYNGKIGKTALGMVIRPVAAHTYLFGIQGVGAKGLPSHYPVQFTLTIGNYTSTEKIKSGYTGPPMTPKEICQYFHLDCSQ